MDATAVSTDSGNNNNSNNDNINVSTATMSGCQGENYLGLKYVGSSLQLYITPFVITIGLLCNVWTLLQVKKSFGKKKSASIFLTSGSVTNISCLILAVIRKVIELVLNINPLSAIGKLCWATTFITSLMQCMSGWTALVMTCERLFIVAAPDKARCLCTRPNALLITKCFVVGAIILTVASLCIEHIITGNIVMLTCDNQGWLSLLVSVIVVFPGLPLLVTNLLLIVMVLRRRESFLRAMPAGSTTTLRRRLYHRTVSVCCNSLISLVIKLPLMSVAIGNVLMEGQLDQQVDGFMRLVYFFLRLLNHSNTFLFLYTYAYLPLEPTVIRVRSKIRLESWV